MRRIIGSLLLLVAIALIVGIVGCLKVPLGNPEQSKVDEKLTGFWLLKDANPDDNQLVSIVPYDARTSLLTYMIFARDAQSGITPRSVATYKMWLTDVGGAKFITLESKGPATLIDDAEKRYPVMRLTRDGNKLGVSVVAEKFVSDSNVTTPEALEKLISTHLNDMDLYDGQATFELLGPDRADQTRAILDAFHHSP